MDHAFQRGNILSLKESLVAGDYATTAKIMREVTKNNASFKHRADIKADFVEHNKMEFDGVHIVQAGDTASRIAKSSGISFY